MKRLRKNQGIFLAGLLGLLTLVTPAKIFAAADTAKIEEESLSSILLEKGGLALIKKSECLATLGPLVDPAKIIGAGISALANQNAPGALSACFHEISNTWQENFPNDEEAPFSPAEIVMVESKQFKFLFDHCFNPAKAGSVDHIFYQNSLALPCEGKKIEGPENASLGKKYKKVLADAELFQANQNAKRTLLEKVGALFKGDGDDANMRSSYIQSIVSLPFAPFDRERGIAIVNELRCRSSANPMPKYCEDLEILSVVQEEERNTKLREVFKALSANTDDLKQIHIKLREESNRRESAFYAKERKSINLRRLLSAYALKDQKKPNAEVSLPTFCDEFEARQRLLGQLKESGITVRKFAEPEAWRYALEHGFDEGDVAVVHAYTGNHYIQLNSALREQRGKPTGTVGFVTSLLNQTLDKFPAYEKIVARYAALPESVLDMHQVGAVVEYPAFTSTTKNQNLAKASSSAGAQASHFFLIYPGTSGKDVQPISAYPGEEEVLFKAGTRFKVLAREPVPGSPLRYRFVMAEVDAEGKVIANLPSEGRKE